MSLYVGNNAGWYRAGHSADKMCVADWLRLPSLAVEATLSLT